MPTTNLPRWAVVKGRGKCRVIEYHGNGNFTLLTKGGRKLFVNRKNIVFTK